MEKNIAEKENKLIRYFDVSHKGKIKEINKKEARYE